MRKEIKRIEVITYRDSDNNPTCAIDFNTGEVCRFYRTQRFGVNETCVFAEQDGKYTQTLNRRRDGLGTLIPCGNCPIWNKK
jgi:hypothetical protein